MESRFFGFTVKKIQKLAYNLAEEACIPHLFNTKIKEAGQDCAERRRHVAVVCCIGLSGQSTPPVLIFPRKTFNPNLYDEAPPGTLKLFNDPDYMVGELFVKGVEHFIQHVNSSSTNKVLMKLDGHSSHKSIEALELAKKSGVILLCLPPHCTGRLQPLDVGIFGLVDTFYNREFEICCSFSGSRKSNKNRSTGTQVLTKSLLIKEPKEKQIIKKTKELKRLHKNRSIEALAGGRKNIKEIRKSKRPVKQRRLILDPVDYEDDDDADTACLYCNNLYKQSKLHSIFQSGPKIFINMEYAENGDLHSYLKKKILSEDQIRSWFRQILWAFKYMHSVGIVHRDIKCENILLTAKYNVRIADFGFTRFVGRGRHPGADTICGTLSYSSPELVSALRPYNPIAADIWALGVVLFVMSNNTTPFKDKNKDEMYKKQMSKQYKFQEIKSRSDNLKDLVASFLEPNVGFRIQLKKALQHPWLKNNNEKTPTNVRKAIEIGFAKRSFMNIPNITSTTLKNNDSIKYQRSILIESTSVFNEIFEDEEIEDEDMFFN
ncbi:serine/threonine-protein kinase H1 homolog [Daktulosphaira vitifoliae]|uniref:serine/threonine-protein kinase H1 homolog n=1 Tax=Daktulosphaira vitifoliae TaxID=58002 RepID=UPI0021A9B6B9|nr:serine/threonine-protein kinase H1 homolog [Daktulosphaira vitifoliae]